MGVGFGRGTRDTLDMVEFVGIQEEKGRRCGRIVFRGLTITGRNMGNYLFVIDVTIRRV